MIEQNATVVTVNGNRATVTAERAAGCGTCASGGGCGAGVLGRVFGNRPTTLEVTTDVAVKPGDAVVIGMREDALLAGALWTYMVPLGVFFAGTVMGHTLAGNTGGGELLTVLGGAAGGAAGIAIVSARARSRRDDALYMPVVLRRLDLGLTVVPPSS